MAVRKMTPAQRIIRTVPAYTHSLDALDNVDMIPRHRLTYTLTSEGGFNSLTEDQL